ncbi:uncharacterized protein LTR77_000584 [Saxophila tyrrhenica]|uniref:MARVEL domain-containing protein n=1 Tax=Saxophila tyrrhenica TaxID=1690608 RepID=A0AAV9PSZ2_9PEZI|nr:hypothetical protein LTR77_000584 [Saxophila tyrrhenica]
MSAQASSTPPHDMSKKDQMPRTPRAYDILKFLQLIISAIVWFPLIIMLINDPHMPLAIIGCLAALLTVLSGIFFILTMPWPRNFLLALFITDVLATIFWFATWVMLAAAIALAVHGRGPLLAERVLHLLGTLAPWIMAALALSVLNWLLFSAGLFLLLKTLMDLRKNGGATTTVSTKEQPQDTQPAAATEQPATTTTTTTT